MNEASQEALIGHHGVVILRDDGLWVVCHCGWGRELYPEVAPSDPLRVWNGHAWRVILGMEEEPS